MMIFAAITLLIIGGFQLFGSCVIALLKSDTETRERANLLAQWSVGSSLLAIGILLIEALI